jgi:hypothetical protein
MNEEDLRKLIDKYYEGKSTDDDERLLRAVLSSTDLPAEFEPDRQILGYFRDKMSVPEPSAGFENRIRRNVRSESGYRRSAGARRIVISALGMAAGLLLLLASYFFLARDSGIKDTFDDPKLAYAETVKVLIQVSAKLNQGTRPLQHVAMINDMQVKSFETINQSAEIIEKNLRSLRYLKKATGNNDTLTNQDNNQN